eukprot:m.75440 g.75440  ORF g.75440 m.75440 type:complete len:129 (+) comp8482_c0_seq1:965-1351(+)
MNVGSKCLFQVQLQFHMREKRCHRIKRHGHVRITKNHSHENLCRQKKKKKHKGNSFRSIVSSLSEHNNALRNADSKYFIYIVFIDSCYRVNYVWQQRSIVISYIEIIVEKHGYAEPEKYSEINKQIYF